MASTQQTVDFISDQIRGAGDIRSRKMFGEFAVYCNEKVVAFVCDDQLYMKPTDIGYTFLDASHEAPPYPGAKKYLRVPEDKWDDSDWLTDFVRQTANVLPMPKLRRKS
jgi:TfoX/Sxy family transcriptional regulator of competence genes